MTREATACKHRVAGGMPKQVVDFLEPVEVKAEHGETFPLGQRGNFLVDPPIEMVAIGQAAVSAS